MTSGWNHKDEWKRQERTFSVVVSRHTEATLNEGAGYDAEGPNRWCVYGYVYPTHPDFKAFDAEKGMWDQPTPPMHGGCTFFRAHRKDDGSIVSYQFGCDYHHLEDWRFTQQATLEDAYEVFADAEEIYQWLQQRGAR